MVSGMKNDARKVVFVKSLLDDKIGIGTKSVSLMGDLKYLCV